MIIKSTGALLGASVISSGMAVADRTELSPEVEDWKAEVRREYGKKEADAAAPIVQRYYEQKRSGEISDSEYHSQITSELLSMDRTRQLALEVLSIDRDIGVKNDAISEVNAAELPNNGVESTVGSGTPSLTRNNLKNQYILTQGYTYRNSTAGGDADANIGTECFGYDSCADAPDIVDPAPDRMNVAASAGVYGNARAETKLYLPDWSPNSDGDYEFTSRVFRKGTINGGNFEMRIVLNKPDDADEDPVIDTASTDVNGKVVDDVVFTNLSSSKNYDIGIKAVTTASTGGGTARANFANASKRVEPVQDNALDEPAIQIDRI